MALPDIFSKDVSDHVIQRINQLKPNTRAHWGKMNVAQMIAHCNVMYELVYEDKYPKPKFFMRFILKSFVKKIVTSEMPYKRNGQTAPAFIIKDNRAFEAEKVRLINYVHKTHALGQAHFDNKLSHSFGTLSNTEWNNMFYKHLDHHLTQFGA